MSSRAPIVRQISWPMVIPQVAVLGLLIGGAYLFTPRISLAAVWGAAIYLAYSYGSRMLLAQHHARGTALMRGEKFAEAIDAFRESYAFFTRRSWLDRYRCVTMLTASAAGYREMALLNIAYCFAQLGDGASMKEYYQRTLVEYPGSCVASVGLKTIEAFEHKE